MAAFVPAGVDETSLADLKQSHAAEKADLEKSLEASEERLTDGSVVSKHLSIKRIPWMTW